MRLYKNFQTAHHLTPSSSWSSCWGSRCIQGTERKEAMDLLDTSALFETMTDEVDPDEDIITALRTDEAIDVPIELTDLDLWANYTNYDLYIMDQKLREFIKRIRWKKETHGGYRTTASVVFAWIYGRQPTPNDGYVFRLLHELLKYYCTSYTGQTTYRGKKVNRVYRFSSHAATHKRPYSLRLRLEEAAKNGTQSQSILHRNPDAGKDKRQHGRRAHRADGGSSPS